MRGASAYEAAESAEAITQLEGARDAALQARRTSPARALTPRCAQRTICTLHRAD